MFDIFSASGFFVHTPCGPRKSGMPESVEMPAPVSATTRSASCTQERTCAVFLLAMPNSNLRRVIDSATPLWAGEAEVVRTYWSSPKRNTATDLLWLSRQCFKEFWG